MQLGCPLRGFNEPITSTVMCDFLPITAPCYNTPLKGSNVVGSRNRQRIADISNAYIYSLTALALSHLITTAVQLHGVLATFTAYASQFVFSCCSTRIRFTVAVCCEIMTLSSRKSSLEVAPTTPARRTQRKKNKNTYMS